MSKRRTTCTVASHWALTSPSVAPPPRRSRPTDCRPHRPAVKCAWLATWPAVTRRLHVSYRRYTTVGAPTAAIMRLCDYVLPSFLPSVPGRCRHMDPGIKSAPVGRLCAVGWPPERRIAPARRALNLCMYFCACASPCARGDYTVATRAVSLTTFGNFSV